MMTMINSNLPSDFVFSDDFIEDLIDILIAAYDGDLPVLANGFDQQDVAAAASLGFITTQVLSDVFCGEWFLTSTGHDFLEAAGEINEDEDDDYEDEEYAKD